MPDDCWCAAVAVRQDMYQDTPTGGMCRVPAGAYVSVDAHTHTEGCVFHAARCARGEVMQHLWCLVLLKWDGCTSGEMKSLNLDVSNGISKHWPFCASWGYNVSHMTAGYLQGLLSVALSNHSTLDWSPLGSRLDLSRTGRRKGGFFVFFSRVVYRSPQ